MGLRKGIPLPTVIHDSAFWNIWAAAATSPSLAFRNRSREKAAASGNAAFISFSPARVAPRSNSASSGSPGGGRGLYLWGCAGSGASAGQGGVGVATDNPTRCTGRCGWTSRTEERRGINRGIHGRLQRGRGSHKASRGTSTDPGIPASQPPDATTEAWQQGRPGRLYALQCGRAQAMGSPHPEHPTATGPDMQRTWRMGPSQHPRGTAVRCCGWCEGVGRGADQR